METYQEFQYRIRRSVRKHIATRIRKVRKNPPTFQEICREAEETRDQTYFLKLPEQKAMRVPKEKKRKKDFTKKDAKKLETVSRERATATGYEIGGIVRWSERN